MKKSLILASIFIAFNFNAQAASADSTNYKKMDEAINKLNKLYADSVAIITSEMSKKNIELRKNKEMTDSTRKIQTNAIFAGQREKLVALRKRQSAAIAKLRQQQQESLKSK